MTDPSNKAELVKAINVHIERYAGDPTYKGEHMTEHRRNTFAAALFFEVLKMAETGKVKAIDIYAITIGKLVEMANKEAVNSSDKLHSWLDLRH